LSTWVDRVATEYESALDARLAQFAASGPDRAALELNSDLVTHGFQRNLFSLIRDNRGDIESLKDKRTASDGALICLVGRDRAKALLRERVEGLVLRDDGLPAAARRARLAELDAQIQAVEDELESMREALRASGLAVPAPTPAPGPLTPRI
jgi:hypothetical protein